VIGSLGSSIFVSRVHRDIVTADATVRRYAEQLVAAPYVPCATAAQYPAMTNVPAGYTATIIAIAYANEEDAAPAFGPTCAPSPLHEIQRITITARRTNGAGVQRLDIVKRAS
jgi:hypothetical protein